MSSVDPVGPTSDWRRSLAARFACHKLIKMSCTVAGMAFFFYLYFWVMRHPSVPPLVMPVTALDHWFDIREWAIVLYASLWWYVPIGPAMARNLKDLLAFGWGSALMTAVGIGIFRFFPTAVPNTEADWAHYPMLQFLKVSDVAGNAFPSMHVAFATYTAGAISAHLRQAGAPAWLGWLNLAWATTIVYSTLATRQHVVLDVIGGVVLGLMAIRLTLRAYRLPIDNA